MAYRRCLLYTFHIEKIIGERFWRQRVYTMVFGWHLTVENGSHINQLFRCLYKWPAKQPSPIKLNRIQLKIKHFILWQISYKNLINKFHYLLRMHGQPGPIRVNCLRRV